MPSLRTLLVGGAAALLAGWGITTALQVHHQHQGTQAEQISHQQDQEAQSHAQAARAIPQHAAALAAAQARADAAEAKANAAKAQSGRLLKERAALLARLAAQAPAPPDLRDQVIAKDKEVISAQVAQIDGLQGQVSALEGQVGQLKLAFSDEQARSAQWQAAFQHEQQARLAQEVATRAWKDAVRESRWMGRFEGFVTGAAVGYAGGKL